MEISHCLSLAALFVSIIALLVSIKSFKASNYPSLDSSLDIHENTIGEFRSARLYQKLYEYRFTICIKNLSSNITASQIGYSIKFKDPFWRKHFWRKRWLLYDSGIGKKPIEPQMSDSIQTNGNIESYLTKNLPSLIEKFEIPHGAEPGTITSYYSPCDPRDLKVLLIVKYKSAMVGMGFCKISKAYMLLPNPQSYSGLPKKIYEWKLKETNRW